MVRVSVQSSRSSMRSGSLRSYNGSRLSRRSRGSTVVSVAPLAKPQTMTGLIKRVIKGSAETKEVLWYSGPTPSNGTFAQASYINQNASIATNATDIQRLIPYVVSGTGDNQRIGEKIKPVALNLKGSVCLFTNNINPPNNTTGRTQDLYVVIYILQHVTLKSYTALQLSNDFNQLLKTGENTTVPFNGHVWESQMPVEDAYYKLLKKKKYRLRFYGTQQAQAGDPPGNAWVSQTNPHSYRAEYNISLSKHLPANFKYPESNATSGLNDPTNSSIFMCMGVYQADGSVLNGVSVIQQQYVTSLKYKDI